MSDKVTARPWTLWVGHSVVVAGTITENKDWSIKGNPLAEVANCNPDDELPEAEAKANAAHIVQCVNAHDKLVEALTAIRDNTLTDRLEGPELRAQNECNLRYAADALSTIPAREKEER